MHGKDLEGQLLGLAQLDDLLRGDALMLGCGPGFSLLRLLSQASKDE